jgi:hypothetical protein
MRGAALLFLCVCGAAVGLAGCGGGKATSARELRLQREDLLAASRALRQAEASVSAELAASKQAWRLVANGPPQEAGRLANARAAVEAAARSAGQVRVPAPFSEDHLRGLTGPAAAVGGLFHSYAVLAQRGWSLIAYSMRQIQSGPGATARFARENVPLYIESVYDAHFALAHVGKKLHDGYLHLGGADAFGASLTPAEVERLTRAYSEEPVRLHPHVGVRLGS